MKKESMRMKKDIRAYEYEELQKELERLNVSEKNLFGQNRYINGCI